jgi:hypothetical protein
MGIDLTGLGSVADLAKSIVDRIFPPSANPEEKLKAQTELQRMIEERENTVVKAKTDIMVAELNQDDRYTKRGRPTILYGGLLFIGLNHVLFPMIAWVMNFTAEHRAPELPNLSLPEEFWWAWAGVCSIYVLGRSAEKMGGESGGLVGKIFGGIGAKK